MYAWLRENYDGWVVVEQNYTERRPSESLRISWDWLHGDKHRRARRAGRAREPAARQATRPLPTLQEHAEQVVGVPNQYLGGMIQVVFKHGGTLEKFTGDGMMVFFSAPSLRDDYAQRAVQAAVEMQERARRTSKARGDSEWAVEYGIGITPGE